MRLTLFDYVIVFICTLVINGSVWLVLVPVGWWTVLGMAATGFAIGWSYPDWRAREQGPPR